MDPLLLMPSCQYYIKRNQTRSLQSLIYPDLLKDRKTDLIKMRTFLLALGFALICASSQFDPEEINGDWRSILMGANNVEKIEQGGDLRVHLRHLECVDECDKLLITFYLKLNGECQKFSVEGIKGANEVYETDFSGDNYFQIKYVRSRIILFYNKNVDADGKVTYATLIADHILQIS
uniref:female-specific lacrimal gland protein-like n=1 Tax=Ictidomys tridecemlineatus TaxID=43179 RepID=UPI001A9CC35E|nr:female-specific lacrimal gland protein-like [Ictidomys tridecemlineatus]